MATEEDEEIALLEQFLLGEAVNAEKAENKTSEESLVRPKNSYFNDDSDDEQNGLYSKYSSYGNEINKKLKKDEELKKYNSIKVTANNLPGTSKNFPSSSSLNNASNPYMKTTTSNVITTTSSSTPLINPKPSSANPSSILKEAVFCDPIFGLRIVNPVISSVSLKERMAGKMPIGVQRVRFHTERGDQSQDWVIAGVLVSKSPVKQTQKGDSFSIWTISDLRGEMKMVTVFLFRNAHQELWKNSVGTVIAILNPKSLERKDDKVEAVLSVDNHQKVMILGQSKDLGKCGAKKNNGELCGAIVNKTDCDVCIFHMKKEYGKIKRSEFQTSGLGRGLNDLRNKVLGKSEIFYAGQSFTAVKAKKPVKQMAKDRERMMTLSEYYSMPYNSEASAASNITTTAPLIRTPVVPQMRTPLTQNQVTQQQPQSLVSQTGGLVKRAASLDHTISQRKKDLERLKQLQGTSSPQIILTPKFQQEARLLKAKESPAIAQQAPPQNDTNFVPKLTSENLTFSFSMNSKCSNDVAKKRAAEILKKKPLETTNPNLIKYRGTEAGKKRIHDELNNSFENDAKKAKIDELEEAKKKREFIERMMNAKSSHSDLNENLEREKQQKCFDRLEKKEAMEEKMANTTEMKCKAVICRKCKYIYFSASDLCKQRGHELRVVDATKRFYQCGDCKTRTVTLFRIPRDPCKNCRSANWKRTGMMAEKIAYIGEQLSIRGDEEMFIGSATKANVNLLVPETNEK